MEAAITEAVEMVTNARVKVAAGRAGRTAEARRRARHGAHVSCLSVRPCVRLSHDDGAHVSLALLERRLSSQELRQTDVTLFAVRLAELERRPRHVT